MRATPLLAITALIGAPALAQPTPADRFAPRWDLRVGHSYSSAQALGQPATFVVIAESDAPTLTALDGAILGSGPLGTRGRVEAGLRISGGSARRKSRRVIGGIVRAWQHRGPMIAALAGEYEADGGFDVEKGVVNAEFSIVEGLPGLGTWVRPTFRLRWRPWIGVGYGNVFSTRNAAADMERDDFFRAYARLEIAYSAGEAETGLEATSWLVRGDLRGTNFMKGALSVPLAGGLSLSASAEVGRQPPRFEYSRRLGVGLGFRWRVGG